MSIKSLDFYSYFFCPYALRSLIAISEAQIANKLPKFSTVDKLTNFRYHEIDLHKDKQKEASFLAINPQHKVPVLKIELDDGTTFHINESLVLNEFIQEHFHNDLIPKGRNELETATRKAQSRIWISYFDSNIPGVFNKILFEKPTKERVLSELLPQIQEKLSFLAQHGFRVNNDESGSFFFGSNFSLIDAALYPFLSRIDIILRRKFQTDLFETVPALAKNGVDVQQDLLVWKQWLSAAKERQSAKWSSYEPLFVPEATYANMLRKELTGEEVEDSNRGDEISRNELNTHGFDYEKYFLKGLELLSEKFAQQKK